MYLRNLLARLDQDAGWCGIFWQRDPDGMRVCLTGAEVPPWDVVEALLQDLGVGGGSYEAEVEAETVRARALHRASLTAFDARPGGRDLLGDRLDVMLREQRYAAERQVELAQLLHTAATREQAEAMRLDLAWARDDHERATARCAELHRRIADLDRRPRHRHHPCPYRSSARSRRRPNPRDAPNRPRSASAAPAAAPVSPECPTRPRPPTTRPCPPPSPFRARYGTCREPPRRPVRRSRRRGGDGTARPAAPRQRGARRHRRLRRRTPPAARRGPQRGGARRARRGRPLARRPIPAARRRVNRAGLDADWATLLWETASLPADLLVAAADALAAAGRTADAQQILRQGVGRPAPRSAHRAPSDRRGPPS